MMLAIDISALTIGEVFGAFIIVLAVIFSLYEIGTKLYGMFMKAHNQKSQNEEFRETVLQHTDDIQRINEKLDLLVETITKQEEQNKKVDCAILRDRIIQSYQYHKDKGDIGALEYENLNEMFNQYFARGGNHLVSKIYKDFQTWQVTLDDK